YSFVSSEIKTPHAKMTFHDAGLSGGNLMATIRHRSLFYGLLAPGSEWMIPVSIIVYSVLLFHLKTHVKVFRALYFKTGRVIG
ncbi:MAG TPA: hypothetical protein PK307_14995, partial [Spirochaetota bacterium]|nr:hypothetical protein [Spirochaetota bacterium]